MKNDCELLAGFKLPAECPPGYSIRQLTGDASTRSYYRISTPSGTSVILMKMPGPFDENDFPYLDNYRLLLSAGVELAEIYLRVPDRGLIFLQDLGDFTFYEMNSGWSAQTRLHYYLEAMEYLRRIEQIKPQSDLAFDTAKLSWELEFFEEHFLGGLRKAELSPQESSELREHFTRLARELAERPRGFCHRDYHSRNLMVHEERIYVIDFQDARLGPVTYDLASLCYDSYIQHSQELIGHLERLFFIYHPDSQTQRYEYPRMCLQRNLKALGTFGYQAVKLERGFYLQFPGPTLGYVKRHFEKLPEYAEMRKLLASHLPELRS